MVATEGAWLPTTDGSTECASSPSLDGLDDLSSRPSSSSMASIVAAFVFGELASFEAALHTRTNTEKSTTPTQSWSSSVHNNFWSTVQMLSRCINDWYRSYVMTPAGASPSMPLQVKLNTSSSASNSDCKRSATSFQVVDGRKPKEFFIDFASVGKTHGSDLMSSSTTFLCSTAQTQKLRAITQEERACPVSSDTSPKHDPLDNLQTSSSSQRGGRSPTCTVAKPSRRKYNSEPASPCLITKSVGRYVSSFSDKMIFRNAGVDMFCRNGACITKVTFKNARTSSWMRRGMY
mmetsp:Transcript_48949/g.149005  ORF Transcript_48949/g.149005 Transcript_48949/m.149005 type:complete len:291 (+) Transcript_48949:590-1462(+)